MNKKVQFTSSVNEDVAILFKQKCKDLGIKKYSEVVEALLRTFNEDQLKLDIEVVRYKITKQ